MHKITGAGSIPRSGRSPGVGNESPLQCSCLESPMDRGACWVHRVAKSWTWLSTWAQAWATLCLFIGAFSSFTFKFMFSSFTLLRGCTFLPFCSLLSGYFYSFFFFFKFFSSSFALLPCDLISIFGVMLYFLSLLCVYIYYRLWFVVALKFIYRKLYI